MVFMKFKEQLEEFLIKGHNDWPILQEISLLRKYFESMQVFTPPRASSFC